MAQDHYGVVDGRKDPASLAVTLAEFGGLHRCWNEAADQRPATVCGCAPGRCADKPHFAEPMGGEGQ